MLKKIVSWISVMSVMVLIFCLSAEPAVESSERSRMFLIFPFLSQYTVRKSAHFFIYMILAYLVYRLLTQYKTDITYLSIGKNIYYMTTLIVFLYAITDEIHQYFVPGRACRATDVLIDVLGGVTGLVFSNIISYLYKKCRWKIKF